MKRFCIIVKDDDESTYSCDREDQIIDAVNDAICDGASQEDLTLVELVPVPMKVEANVYRAIDGLRISLRDDVDPPANMPLEPLDPQRIDKGENI